MVLMNLRSRKLPNTFASWRIVFIEPCSTSNNLCTCCHLLFSVCLAYAYIMPQEKKKLSTRFNRLSFGSEKHVHTGLASGQNPKRALGRTRPILNPSLLFKRICCILWHVYQLFRFFVFSFGHYRNIHSVLYAHVCESNVLKASLFLGCFSYNQFDFALLVKCSFGLHETFVWYVCLKHKCHIFAVQKTIVYYKKCICYFSNKKTCGLFCEPQS